MWFLDALVSGFQTPTDPARIQWFRFITGLACTYRFAIACGHGGWNRYAPESLSSAVLRERLGDVRFTVFARAYQPVLAARIVPAFTLAAGFLPHLSALLVLAGLAFELISIKSPNSIRFALLAVTCLLTAPDLGSGPVIRHASTSHNTWAQWLMVLITIDVYWNSAWHKAHSAQFRSGRYLAQWVHVYAQVKNQLPYREHWIPAVIRTRLGTLSDGNVAVWRAVAVAVIALEVALPAALLAPPTRPYAIAVGIAMHAGFCCLKPRQLIFFSSLTIGSYVLFAA